MKQQNTDNITRNLLQHSSEGFPGEQAAVNLNHLIEEVHQQAIHYMRNRYPDFVCTVQLDLEKILPPMKVFPAQIRHVIFHLLMNAFEGVYEKKQETPKGYDPKVVIVTRKLPRFVQVRVRDNGVGIPEKSQPLIFDNYFSLKNPELHSGLGLSESLRIIKQVHKGELFLESDFTSGTDFIIRFPINN